MLLTPLLRADQLVQVNAPPANGDVAIEGDQLFLVSNGQRSGIDWANVQSIVLAPHAHASRGLRGEYFVDAELKKLSRVRLDPRIAFDSRWNRTAEPFMHQPFSVRWTGRVKPATTERHTFHLVSEDGARLWLDNKLVIDRWDDVSREPTFSIDLQSGVELPIRVEYRKTRSEARIFLAWWTPTIAREYVPSDRLLPDPVPQPIADDPTLPRGFELLAKSDAEWGQEVRLEATSMTLDDRSPLVDRLPRSARRFTFRGLLRAKYSEPHVVTIDAEGDVSMTVNGKSVLAAPAAGKTGWEGAIDLKASEFTPFQISFVQRGDQRPRFNARWFSQLMGSEPLDRSVFRDPAAVRMGDDTGWVATIYSDLQFSRFASEGRFVGQRQEWIAPPGTPGDQFSVRVAGRLRVPRAGEYRFRIRHDDEAKFVIDGQHLYIGKAFGEGTSKPIKLEPGRDYDVVIDVANSGGGPASLELRWSTDDRNYEDLPSSAELPPTTLNAAPVIVLREPATGSVATTDRVAIRVQLDPPNSGDKIELLSRDRVLAESSIDNPSFEWVNPPAGAHELQARVLKDGKPVCISSRAVVHVGTPLKQFAGWTLYPGVVSASDVEMNDSAVPLALRARRSALMDNTDRVPAVLKEIEGDFELSVQIDSLKLDGPGSCAGLIVRPSLAQRGRSVALGLSGPGDPFTASRAVRGDDIVIQGARLAAGATFLRIQREGSLITLSAASRPGEWTTIDTRKLEVDGPYLAGVFVVGETDTFSEVKIRNLALVPRVSVLHEPLVGLLLRNGEFIAGKVRRTDEQGRFRVERAAGEEWVEADRVAAWLNESNDAPPASLPSVMLRSGDSFDGNYTGLVDERVFITTLLFGPSDYAIKDVAALWFAPVDNRGAFTVTIADGSRFPADRITGKGERLELHRKGTTPTELPFDQIDRIDRVPLTP